jgi:L-rhamnose mutarotase
MNRVLGLTTCVLAGVLLMGAGKPAPVTRVGMVIELDGSKIDEYKALHADGNPGVRDLLGKYHMRNFSIFLHEIGGRYYEFGYYEYTGTDFEADMARLAAEPRNDAWLKICDPMQIPLPGEESWAVMEQVYFNP